VDSLSTRGDVDTTRLAYLGLSLGAGTRRLHAAVEPRYRAVVFVGGGIHRAATLMLPEVNPISFAPFIVAPTLMINGRQDEDTPYRTNALPLWNLLRGPKEAVVVDGGHLVPEVLRVPAVNGFLDRVLGPVRFSP
jgi:dienelactone hydrolase